MTKFVSFEEGSSEGKISRNRTIDLQPHRLHDQLTRVLDQHQ